MKKFLIQFLILLFIAFNSIAFAQIGTDYYPLRVGSYWIYENSNKGENAEAPSKVKNCVECIEVLNNQETFRVKGTIIENDDLLVGVNYNLYKQYSNEYHHLSLNQLSYEMLESFWLPLL